MKNKVTFALSISMLILISGCVGLLDVFGSNAVNIKQSVVENGVHDVIAVKNIQTIPSSPLLPNQKVVMSFIIQNMDKLNTAKNVRVDLFNAPTMKSEDGTPCNLYSGSSTTSQCQNCISRGIGGVCPDTGECTNTGPCQSAVWQACTGSSNRYCRPQENLCGVDNPCAVLPGEEKPINFILVTPSEDDIKNIRTRTELDFKTTYDYHGSLNYILPAINLDEIISRQRTGQKTDLFATKSYSSGPIQVDVLIQGAPYMLSTYDTVLFFTINNKGSGILANSQIDIGKLKIDFPPGMGVGDEPQKFSSEIFTCQSSAIGGTECTNTKAVIPLYRDQSRNSLRFTVRARDAFQEPFKSFQITADVDYSYELRNNIDLTINPFQNV